MKRFLALILLVVAFVGCDKFDDNNLDRYVKKGTKSVEVQKAIEILSEGTGFWYGNADKSFDIRDGQMVPFNESGVLGYGFDKYEFESDSTINIYSYAIAYGERWINRGYIDWESMKIYKGRPESTVYYKIRGVTDNYLILEDCLLDVIIVCERMPEAQVAKYLSNTEFVDKRK